MRKKLTIICLLTLSICALSTQAATIDTEESNNDDQRRGRGYIAIDPMGPDEPSLIIIGTPDNHRLRHQYMRMFRETMEPGFQESKPPRFVISSKDSRFLFGIGGYVNFRTAYDFDGMVENTDFVTYDIPIPGTPATRGKINMDASTTRLFFKIIGRTKRLGNIETYIETDFRGDGNTLRLRKAYISFLGFLFGQNTTTFCDLTAAPTTIDYEGPNGYSYDRNLQIRYSHAFNDHWSVALAVEYPMLSATYANMLNSSLPQRVPDIPGYVQFTW